MSKRLYCAIAHHDLQTFSYQLYTNTKLENRINIILTLVVSRNYMILRMITFIFIDNYKQSYVRNCTFSLAFLIVLRIVGRYQTAISDCILR